MLFQPLPETRIGISYRAAVNHNATGTTDVNGVASVSNSSSITLPDTAILSLSQMQTERVRLLGDIARTGWSSIQASTVSSGALGTDTIPVNFRNTWRITLGVDYKYDDAWTLKASVADDQSPAHDANYRMVALPDRDRTWLLLGFRYKVSPTTRVDFGYTHLFAGTQNIDRNAGNSMTKGTTVGTYRDNAKIVGAQFSMAY